MPLPAPRRLVAVLDGSMTGKTVIVTGGNQGVGRVIARRFLEEGASVVTCSRREYEQPPAAEGLDAEVAARCFHVRCDHREVDQIDRVIEQTLRVHGRIDALVNNAGGSPPVETATASPRFHASIININLTGPLLFSQRVFPVMDGQEEGGSIVNISSMASVMPAPALVAYGAAKAGLNHMTRCLAAEWGPKVRVNCIALGTIWTEALEEHILPPDEESRRRFVEAIPMQRIGRPEEIANICVFLCSDLAPYVNGSTIWADGGGSRGGR